jgi:hypothetical protein
MGFFGTPVETLEEEKTPTLNKVLFQWANLQRELETCPEGRHHSVADLADSALSALNFKLGQLTQSQRDLIASAAYLDPENLEDIEELCDTSGYWPSKEMVELSPLAPNSWVNRLKNI